MEIVCKRFEELTLSELYEILRLRTQVFVVEQKCPYQEVDGMDKNAYHFWLEDEGEIKAYLRILDAGTVFPETGIGRVLTAQRGRGYAKTLLSAALKTAKESLNVHSIRLEAQTYAVGMYEKFGFRTVSEEFLEDGIPHVQMLLDL